MYNPYTHVKKHKKRIYIGKCYTCFPRDYHNQFLVSETENAKFLFDLAKRPIIIITSKQHYKDIFEVPPNTLDAILKDIQSFCDLRNIKDFSLSVNTGRWKTHDHFHIKLRSYERHINIMRDDHFKLRKLQMLFPDQSCV